MINRVLPSIAIQNIDLEKCYFNPGCAASIYKPELPELMLELLRGRFGSVKLHNICCRHDPGRCNHYQQLRRLRQAVPFRVCRDSDNYLLGNSGHAERSEAAGPHGINCFRARFLFLPPETAGACRCAEHIAKDEYSDYRIGIQRHKFDMLRRYLLFAYPG